MNQSKAILDNTVAAQNQLQRSSEISLIGSNTPAKKVLILGNSITLHEPKSDIGWHGNWGMAASRQENDYVHLLFRKAQAICPDVQFCVVQVSRWERGFWEDDILESFKSAADFAPDVFIFRLGENVREADCADHNYEQSLKQLLEFFTSKKEYTKLILSTSFWAHGSVDETVRNIAKELDAPLCELGHLGEQDQMKAIGLFEHTGVAAHPGDLGMSKISEEIWDSLEHYLL